MARRRFSLVGGDTKGIAAMSSATASAAQDAHNDDGVVSVAVPDDAPDVRPNH